MITVGPPRLVAAVTALGWWPSRCEVVWRRGHPGCRAGWHRRWLLCRERGAGSVVIETGLVSGRMAGHATVTVYDADTAAPICLAAHAPAALHSLAANPPETRAQARPYQDEVARLAQAGLETFHARSAAGQEPTEAYRATLAAGRRRKRKEGGSS